jgi:pyruvate dehydrogenase E2 component (dihydrolipoamide acetyltransferase)
MAHWEFKLPDIGEGVTEGEIVAWLVEPGDVVTEDQPVVELMTDKATVTITAPKAGRVLETRGRVGETVPVHAVLVVFDLGGSVAGMAPPERRSPAIPHAGHANGSTGHTGAPPPPPSSRTTAGAAPALSSADPEAEPYFNDKPLATPSTRKLARDMNVDLRKVPPTGTQGRVTKRDVESFLDLPGEVERGGSARSRANGTEARGPLEERVPMQGLRKRIAQKMSLSKSTAAHFTFVEECDATELKRLRARLKETALERGAKLTLLPFIVKAVVAALKKHPTLNSTVDEAANAVVYRRYYNVGIATATEAGLVVPVVKAADTKSVLDIALDIERLAADARAGKSRIEDLQGSTFTVTSLGAQGGLMATPIINYPEVAILGIHRIKERPVVKNGQIVIGDVMLLSLSFDHRVVDGHVGAAFAYDVIGYLEEPDRLLLEMV